MRRTRPRHWQGMRVRVHRSKEEAIAALRTGAREGLRAAIRFCLDVVMRETASIPSFYRLVDEVVQHLVRNPDVQSLIHEQSANLVGDAVDDLRISAARADTALDRALFALRRRMRGRRA